MNPPFPPLLLKTEKRFCQTLRRAGFSLIEVTLAIGIIAFALLSVVALLPVGLNATRNAEDKAQAVQIMKAITIAIQSASSKPDKLPPAVPAQYIYTPLAPFDKLTPTALTWV